MINPMAMMQMMQQLKGNPMQFLGRRGIQVPQGMTDPKQIVQQMVQSGRVSQQQVQQMASMFGAK